MIGNRLYTIFPLITTVTAYILGVVSAEKDLDDVLKCIPTGERRSDGVNITQSAHDKRQYKYS